jgi:tetratricopeptide (TPR) repeat protein
MESDPKPTTRLPIHCLLLLLIISISPFVFSLGFDFIRNWDDDRYVLLNPWLGDLGFGNLVGIFAQPYYFNYHPLTILSYQLDHAIWGAWAPGFRATNLVLHGLTVLALAWCLRLAGCGVWVATIAAALFGVHPLRVESVVWISERKDLLCALGYLTALGCWLRAGLGGDSRRWLALAVAAYLAALLSKAMAVSFPLVVILYDLLLQRERMRGRAPLYVLLGLLAGLFSWLNLQAQQGAIDSGLSLGERLLLVGWAPLHHGGSTVWPVGLSVLYPIEMRPTLNPVAGIAAVLCMLLGPVLVASSWRREPRVAFGLGAAALALGPVSGIVAVGAAWAADRYSLIPTALLMVGCVPVLAGWLDARAAWQRPALIVAVGLVPLLSVLTAADSQRWRNATTLWSSALERFPDSLEIRRNLADAFSIEAEGATDPLRREALYAQALTVFAADGKALLWRFEALSATGNRAEALELLRRALEVRGIRDANRSWAQLRLAIMAREDGATELADSLITAALAKAPADYQTTQELLFVAWHAEEAGALSAARGLISEAIRREPVHAEAHQALAFVLLAQGHRSDALVSMRRAVSLRPGDADMQRNLAIMERQVGGSNL